MLINKKKKIASLWILPFRPKQKMLYDLNLTRDQEKLMNTKVTVIPIVVRAFGTVSQSMEKRPEELESWLSRTQHC